jgi:caffeoyl-CoA O-methyltransferase
MADTDSRSGSSYHQPAIRTFVDELHHGESVAMRRAIEAIAAEGMPAIQVGAGDGAALATLLAAASARKVVEIGTLSGYSALWMLRAIPSDGRLWTIEASPHHARVARGILNDSGLADRVEVLEGAALDRLPDLEPHAPFDAVFIDADKTSYPAYGRWALDHLRPGGLVIADNAFLFGYLAGREPDDRASRTEIEAMQRSHRLIAEHCAIRCCLPTPDGLLVGVKA